MEIAEIKHVIEAALLGAGRPMNLDQLGELFGAGSGDIERGMLRAALDELGADYRGRGIELKEVASGYRIQIRPSMTSRLAPLWEQRAPRYSRAMLETLALIAYRQPVTRGDIEAVRGVSVSTNMVRTLLERRWIRVVGRRDVPGRPALYATTREFLDYFGLRRLSDLPPLSEIKDIDDLNVALELPEPGPQAELPVEAAIPAQADAADAVEAGVERQDRAGTSARAEAPDSTDTGG